MKDNRTLKQRYYESYSLARRWNKTRGLTENVKRELLPQAVDAFKNRFKPDNLRSLELILLLGF